MSPYRKEPSKPTELKMLATIMVAHMLMMKNQYLGPYEEPKWYEKVWWKFLYYRIYWVFYIAILGFLIWLIPGF